MYVYSINDDVACNMMRNDRKYWSNITGDSKHIYGTRINIFGRCIFIYMYIYAHIYLLHLIDVTNCIALVLREMFMKMSKRDRYTFIEIT